VDTGQIAELRRWAEGLERDETNRELRAAGRAILLLIEEIERLRAAGPPPPRSTQPPPPPESPESDEESPEEEERVGARRRRREEPEPRSWRGLFRLAIGLCILGALVFATLALGARLAAPSLDAEGPSQGAGIGPALLPSLAFSVGGNQGVLHRVRWNLDGVDVTDRAYSSAGRVVFKGTSLGDGSHRLKASVTGGFPGSRTTKSWRFTVDTAGPKIRLDPPGVLIPSGHPVRIAGTLEPGASLIADGRPVLVRNGRFQISWRTRPKGAVALIATDPLRNATSRRLWISMRPRTPPHPVRAVHVTFDAWADPTLRQGVLDLIDQGRINAVELDLKDESGTVGWSAAVPLTRRIGSIKPIIDLPEAVKLLHGKGVRVIGRLVCFRDGVMASAAWQAGNRNEVIQTPDGQEYGGYGGFTNFANPVVRRYQIDIAVAAAKAGVDEILYDYVRRPDGPLSSMVFPGLKVTPEQSIVSFLAESRAALEPYKVFLGASVFGVAATRPTEVGQDIPAMAEHLDYVSAMVYPSHWGPGEYGVADPNSQPYDIVRRSLEDFQKDVRGTGARVVPWLQDFTLGVVYGPARVGAEIAGARDAGIDEYLLWDPAVTYTADALPTDARTASFPKRQSTAEVVKSMKPDELGLVPVLMHHQIRSNGSEFDMTAAQLRVELVRLWRDGFYPVRAADLVAGKLDVPKGKTPVVLTFDDADNNQVGFRADGSLEPSTGVGVLEAFAALHPDFPATATFFVPRNAFDGNGRPPAATLRWLVEHGFELGNHTKDHIPLKTLDTEGVQRQLVLGDRVLSDLLPGYRAQTMALPLGALPHPSSLAVRGTWRGQSYRFAGVFLAGAEPAPSPFSTKWDPAAIPRIRTNPNWNGTRDFTAGMWLDILERNPGLRYISDGDAARITFPRSKQDQLAAQYRARAKPS
jgi:peptidoglycan/xylan/chitin deacetylase (PgdA/CDA1 family)